MSAHASAASQRVGGVSLPVCLAIVAVSSTAGWFGGQCASDSAYWEIQVDVFRSLNRYLSAYPLLWSNLTELGNTLILMLLLAPMLLLRPAIWAQLISAIPVAVVLSRGGKALTAIPRPAAVLDPNSFAVIGDTLSGYNSFPSGHATAVFAAATVLASCLWNEPRSRACSFLAILLTVIVLAAAISRVAVGAHWPLDVAAGAVCGYLSGVSGVALVKRYPERWSWILDPAKSRRRAALVLFICVALAVQILERSPYLSALGVCALVIGLLTSFRLFRCARRVPPCIPSAVAPAAS